MTNNTIAALESLNYFTVFMPKGLISTITMPKMSIGKSKINTFGRYGSWFLWDGGCQCGATGPGILHYLA